MIRGTTANQIASARHLHPPSQIARWVAVIILTVVPFATVHAQPSDEQPSGEPPANEAPGNEQPMVEPVSNAPNPWTVGVSEAEQAIALELYSQGNIEFQAGRLIQALTKYREALTHWAHPAIHFNLAVCLINLDQPLEAKHQLELAMRYGEAPLGRDMYLQGITHRHSLDGQIARVEISCAEPGTTITLDGAFLFTAPGSVERLVLPGKHQIVGTKPGYMTATETIELLPARLTKHDVRLIALKSVTRLVRRWPVWKPWLVVGSGASIATLGGLAYGIAKHRFNSYDADVTMHCPRGCDASMTAALQGLESNKDSGNRWQAAAFSLFAVGGAVAITGAIGLYLNQQRPETSSVTPAISATPGGATVAVSSTW
jgi:hypothetical protein